MRRFIAGALAAVAATLVAAAAGSAATFTVQIRSNAFSPSSLTVNHGDRVTFRNADKVDHQVVADDGSFASPILRAGRTWTTATLTTAGTFRYHDALHPSLRGRLTVKGPPPSVTLALNAPIVVYGTPVTLSGAVNSGAANESVELTQQQWGQASPTQLAIVKTGAGGTFSFTVTPSIYTTFVARWKNVASGSVVAQVSPKVRLLSGRNGYMKATVSAPVQMWRKHVVLQRLSPFGQWVSVANLTLGPQNGKIFKPSVYLPKGLSRIRVFLSINQAGIGLLAGHSGTQTVRRR
jgi:plastocyanin